MIRKAIFLLSCYASAQLVLSLPCGVVARRVVFRELSISALAMCLVSKAYLHFSITE